MSLLSRELDHFLAICETRNLARAAEALEISQPALTRSLQRLEARCGNRLFNRAPRGVELTPVGAALRARVEKARIALDDAEKELAQLAAGKIGHVRIGAGNLWVRLVTRSLFPRFIVERPAAEVKFHVAFNAELFALVEAGKLDFAVCGVPDVPPPGLTFHELLSTHATVVVRAGHPLTKIRKPAIGDLAAYRGAASGTGIRARQIFEERMAMFGVRGLPHGIETNSWEAIFEAVATTDLFSLAPWHPALWTEWTSRLVPIDIPELKFAQRVGVVKRADAYTSPLAARAIQLIESTLAEVEVVPPKSPAPAKRAPARVRTA
jgi:DNA-binding transcriptional LysR family regulator